MSEYRRPRRPPPTQFEKRPGLGAPYRIDLAHLSLKLAVELDGPNHQSTAQRKRDRRKDTWLKQMGWKVLRLTNVRALELCTTATCRRSIMAMFRS